MDFIKKMKDEFTTSTSSSGHSQDWYVTVVRAEGIKDESFFSRSDPYIKVEFGGKNFRTRALENDRSPDWNQTFHFQLKSDQAQDITLTLMDDDFGFDDHMGRAILSNANLPHYSNEEKFIEVPIKKNDQVTGVIHLRVKLIDNNMQQQQQSNQSTFQSSNIPYQQQQSSQLSSGYQQQQPMSSYTQPQQFPSQQLPGQGSQQYPSGQFQQGYSTNQPQHHQHQHQQQSNFQQRSNDNYYGKQ